MTFKVPSSSMGFMPRRRTWGGDSLRQNFSGFYNITEPRIILPFALIISFLSHMLLCTPLGNKGRKKENLLLHAKNRSARGKALISMEPSPMISDYILIGCQALRLQSQNDKGQAINCPNYGAPSIS